MFLYIISIVSDFSGIAAFLLSILLLIRTEAVRKRLEQQREDYNSERRLEKLNLLSLREGLVEDKEDGLTLQSVSELRATLYTIEQKYGYLFNFNDKRHINRALGILKNKFLENINKNMLCNELDYIIARFERKEII